MTNEPVRDISNNLDVTSETWQTRENVNVIILRDNWQAANVIKSFNRFPYRFVRTRRVFDLELMNWM